MKRIALTMAALVMLAVVTTQSATASDRSRGSRIGHTVGHLIIGGHGRSYSRGGYGHGNSGNSRYGYGYRGSRNGHGYSRGNGHGYSRGNGHGYSRSYGHGYGSSYGHGSPRRGYR